jgi:hypothetical protein
MTLQASDGVAPGVGGVPLAGEDGWIDHPAGPQCASPEDDSESQVWPCGLGFEVV